jgi:hypothetical protein
VYQQQIQQLGASQSFAVQSETSLDVSTSHSLPLHIDAAFLTLPHYSLSRKCRRRTRGSAW